MPFLRAGFNPRHRRSGIRAFTAPADGGEFAPAELVRFACGDYAWHGAGFIAWGECVAIGTRHEARLPFAMRYGHPVSRLPA